MGRLDGQGARLRVAFMRKPVKHILHNAIERLKTAQAPPYFDGLAPPNGEKSRLGIFLCMVIPPPNNVA